MAHEGAVGRVDIVRTFSRRFGPRPRMLSASRGHFDALFTQQRYGRLYTYLRRRQALCTYTPQKRISVVLMSAMCSCDRALRPHEATTERATDALLRRCLTLVEPLFEGRDRERRKQRHDRRRASSAREGDGRGAAPRGHRPQVLRSPLRVFCNW